MSCNGACVANSNSQDQFADHAETGLSYRISTDHPLPLFPALTALSLSLRFADLAKKKKLKNSSFSSRHPRLALRAQVFFQSLDFCSPLFASLDEGAFESE